MVLDGHKIARLIFAEQCRVVWEAFRELVNFSAYIARKRHFSECDGKPAIGEIMAGGGIAIVNEGRNKRAVLFLGFKINRRRGALFTPCNCVKPCGSAEPARGLTNQQNKFAFGFESKRDRFCHIIDNAEVEGVVNLTAPHPVTNEVFTKILAEVLHRPGKIPAPSFALKALLGGELAEGLLLHGQRVFPKKLEATGFEFESTTLEAGLRSMLG